MADRNSTNSTLRERVVEHVFVGEALRTLWRQDVVDVEVLRPEFDAHGYDLVMVRGKIVRHIQFKTGKTKKPPDVSVSRLLAGAPSGCLIWIHIDDELNLGPYFWFGGEPGDPLPSMEGFKVPKRPTFNRAGTRPDRINHRLIPKRQFVELSSMEDVLARLFGESVTSKAVKS